MELHRPAVHLAGAYLGGVHNFDRLFERALKREVGPATAEFLGMLALVDGARTLVYRFALRTLCQHDPWILPPGVTPNGLTTEQLADAVLGLSPSDAADITKYDSL